MAHLEEDLTKVYEWLMAENLTSKKSKTEFMLIGFNVSIHQIVSTKSPGVYVDENLSPNVVLIKSLKDCL